MIEMMVALTLLTVGILGLAPVFIAANRSASSGIHRTRAFALATRDIEAFRSVPYCNLGFTTGTPPDDVVVTNPSPGAPGPTGSEVVDGITYTFTRSLTWVSTSRVVSTPTTSLQQAYKKATVVVTWKEVARNYSITQNSVIYPGGIGSWSAKKCGTVSNTGYTAPPTGVTDLAATLDSPPDSKVKLTWSDPTATPLNFDQYRILYSSDNFATSYRYTGGDLATSVHQIVLTGLSPLTPYQFQVLARRTSNGEFAPSNTPPTVTTAASTSPSCTIGSTSITPSSVGQASGSSSLSSNPTVNIATGGGCAYLAVKYHTIEDSNFTTIQPLSPGAGTTWTGALSGTSANWSVGPHLIAIQDGAGNVLSETLTLTVCAYPATSC